VRASSISPWLARNLAGLEQCVLVFGFEFENLLVERDGFRQKPVFAQSIAMRMN
jgi:hypothetical protein